MTTTPPFFCSKQQASIPLHGTVKPFTKLLAIETKHPMQAKVLLQNELSLQANNYIAQLQQNIADLKILFIKHASNPINQSKIFAFKYDGKIEEVSFTLPNTNQIINLDLANWFNQATKSETQKRRNRIFVCTNGKRDKCCAKYGLPIYNQLQKSTNWDVWQCSHIGGHRMAPTLITLPDMVFYGNIHLSKLEDFKSHLLQNKIYLKGLRGRAHLPKIYQATEYHLRNHLQLLDANSPINFNTVRQQNDITTIQALVGQKQYTIQLKYHTNPSKIYSSCDQSKLENINYYDLISCQQIDL